jgi:hypothetical protein
MANPNLQLLTDAAKLLEPILGELVFVGGCATALLISDTAADVRPTFDVDAIAENTAPGVTAPDIAVTYSQVVTGTPPFSDIITSATWLVPTLRALAFSNRAVARTSAAAIPCPCRRRGETKQSNATAIIRTSRIYLLHD